MNIESLLEKISLFNEMVVESGFKRDVEEYQTAIQQPQTQTNLVSLKEIANKLIESLQKIEESGLPEAMDILFPKKKVFTNFEHLENLKTIVDDPEMDTSTFYSKLSEEITSLNTQIDSDSTDIEALKKTFSVYISEESGLEASDDKAILAIIFKDLETITSLKKFARTLERWNRTLLIYHQLVSSQSPEDIELLEVQNGSIETIINVDVSVAVDLAALITVGLKVFGAYLVYKSKVHEIVSNYMGNKKLLAQEKERETLLLDNVKEAIKDKLKEQHKLRKKADKNIDGTSLDTRYEQVSSLITEQIVKGNEVKLLSAPKPESEEENEESSEEITQSRELKEQNQQVRILRNKLTQSDVKLLLEKYEVKEEEDTAVTN